MAIRVLGIAGSPRRNGNSETLLDWVLETMRAESGVSVEKVPLDEAGINMCRGCNACEKLNHCIQRDGMDTMHDRLLEADIIVLSSPIFCMGIAAQVKALIDRAQVFRSRKYVLKLPVTDPSRKGKRFGAFLATAGQDWPHVFDAAIPSVQCFYHVIDIRDADISYLMVRNVDEKGAVLDHPTAKQDAVILGQNLVATARQRLGDPTSG